MEHPLASTFYKLEHTIVDALRKGQEPKLDYRQDPVGFALLDQYMDQLMDQGHLVQQDRQLLHGIGWARHMNVLLKDSKYRLQTVFKLTWRFTERSRHLAAYFVVHEKGVPKYTLIFSWSRQPFRLVPLH